VQVTLTVSINDALRQRLVDIVARNGAKLSRAAQTAIAVGLQAQGELLHDSAVMVVVPGTVPG
jgi:hypothetical protein